MDRAKQQEKAECSPGAKQVMTGSPGRECAKQLERAELSQGTKLARTRRAPVPEPPPVSVGWNVAALRRGDGEMPRDLKQLSASIKDARLQRSAYADIPHVNLCWKGNAREDCYLQRVPTGNRR